MASANEEFRRVWRANWLRSIRELAALEWQQSLWGKSENPHHSYVEYVENYVDDLALEDGYWRALTQGLVSQSEVNAVLEMDRLIRGHESPSSEFDHAAILSDPHWVAVTLAAEHARKRLLEIIANNDERLILTAAEPEHP